MIEVIGHTNGNPIAKDAHGLVYAAEPASLLEWFFPPVEVAEASDRMLTWPNAVTILGYCASLAWIAGAPMWLGLLGIVADEIDGRIARATGSVSRFGGELDYAVDMTLTGLSAVRTFGLPGLAMLPIVTSVQAKTHADGVPPLFGSARTVFAAGSILTGRNDVIRLLR